MDSNDQKYKYSKVSDFLYYALKRYVIFMHDTLLLRKRYVFGRENLPKKGEPYFITCNHQNTGNDPINIVISLPFDERPGFMARANLFEIRPFITKFLSWIGMVPAFRFDWEGATGLESNLNSIKIIAERVNAGYPLGIFPEAGHTQGQYINRFTTGAVRIAFTAAEQSGWTEDVKIVPTATHYSDYFDVQTEFIWMIAPPISLKPYYEEYQQHKPSVMRKITHQLHDTIRGMMLDEGQEDYEEKDLLRCSTLNHPGRDRMELPERLKTDKAFIQRLTENPNYEEIISQAKEMKQRLAQIGIDEPTVAQQPSMARCVGTGIILLALLPLWIVSLWPQLLCYGLPLLMLKTDKMFTNTYRFVFAALFIYPLCALVTLLVMGLNFGMWWTAVIWILLWIPIAKLSWAYYVQWRKLKKQIRYQLHRKEIPAIEALRTKIATLL